MSIRMIALDLDDTVLNRELGISDRTKQAIRAAIEKGVVVTIATGRMFCSALPYARQLELDVPLITYNGALIRCSISGETLQHRPVEPEVAARIMQVCKEHGWYIQTYLDDTLYIDTYDDHAKLYEQISGIRPCIVGEKLYTLPGAPDKLLTIGTPEELAEMRQVIGAAVPGQIVMTNSKASFIELVHPEANKGAALDYLAKRFGIAREEIMAVGDSNNDLDMLRFAGWGVAMGNAADHVKSQAQAITAGNDADGVAEAIEKYVLQADYSTPK